MANQTVTSVNPALLNSENKTSPGYGVVISSTVTGIFSAVGTIGNGMVRTSANSFILSISISDIIITGFQYPVGMASSIIGAPSLGHAMCPILGALFFFSIYVSSSSMVLIAFNRYIHITMSTDTYRKLFSPFMSFLWILLSWVVSGLLVAPAFLGYDEFGWNKNRICSVMEGSPYSPQYVSNIFGAFYWLVFCVVVCLYVRIYLFVKKSVVTMAANQNVANPGQYVSKRMLKQTKHMFIIFSIFTVCTAPGVLFFSINVHVDFLPFAAIVVSFTLYRLKYVLNPFLYAWKLPLFRRAFKALIRCKRQLPFQAGAPVN
uniref:G-protein coupled receptors family 1 profile domain-containing protein n=1 Tax=Branchiostoma floridae TaxID=7739 RepID=C3Z0W5_BRAFL|eukprot:XP_002597857.1 hypothetical protein BRAFLDRAFT_105463 [Branchiostoma floridae]